MGHGIDAAGVALPDEAVRARFNELYAELSLIARRELRRGRAYTLDTVAVVNEAFLKLEGGRFDASQRAPFLALAAKAMRHVVVDHVRRKLADKRGGDRYQVTLVTNIPDEPASALLDVMQIEDGLRALGELEPRLVDIVECRFFAGMEFSEIALAMELSERTVYRDWQRARAYLQARMQ